MSEVAKYRGYRRGYWRGYWRRRYKTITSQTIRAKISTCTKVAYPGYGNDFAFGLSGNKVLNLATIFSNCAEWDHYRKLFNLSRVYAVRLEANYVHRSDYIHNYPVAIALVPNNPGGNDVAWNEIRSMDSCLMLNNTNCKMFRRLYNTKVVNNQLTGFDDILFVVGSEAKPADNFNSEWTIKVDVYIKFYGTKL